jgi:hypothetical protein
VECDASETLIARVIGPSTEIKLISQHGDAHALFAHPRSPTAALVSRAAGNYAVPIRAVRIVNRVPKIPKAVVVVVVVVVSGAVSCFPLSHARPRILSRLSSPTIAR